MKHKKYSLMAQGGLLLIAAGLISLFVYSLLNFGGSRILDRYFERHDNQEEMEQKTISALQSYVDENDISVTDTQQLTQWLKKYPVILMEIYRHNTLVYTSAAPDKLQESDSEVSSPYYDWTSDYTVTFFDGDADVILYSNNTISWYFTLNIISVVFSLVLFLLIILYACQKLVRYVCLLSKQIQAMEAGDLNVMVTIQGNNELSALATSLDSMRSTFKEQREREATIFKTHQSMITEMSHDLRTPLTTLQIYTDILRYKKYRPDQLESYLERIDNKAAQIKQLADNIFEYSLVSKQQRICLEPPILVKQVFHDLLSEQVGQLEKKGFQFSFDFQWPPVMISVYSPYIKRLMDNIFSNLMKYADPEIPVQIKAVAQNEVCISISNGIKNNAEKEESTKIGLSNVQTMMQKMNGCCQTAITSNVFSIILKFPIVQAEQGNSLERHDVQGQ